MQIKINQKQFMEYYDVFGSQKMMFLWEEFLSCSFQKWSQLPDVDWQQKRQYFHNWRSSSKVFGMEDFALLCQKIEEKIIKKRYSEAEKLLFEAKQLYEDSTQQVVAFFEEKQKD